MPETKSIMIVGVGGQGTLLASRILGDVLTARGFDVKVSEVHGMAQRAAASSPISNTGKGCIRP
jgi:indolepyruvate ferredoxin oxidoreductase beta subunit